jgi:uncharacterized protein
MKINVMQLKQAIGASQSFHFHSPADKLEDGETVLWLHGDIEVGGQIVNNGRLLAVEGIIRGTARHVCNRCLQEFVCRVKIPFAENYQEEGITSMDDPDLVKFQGDEVDISDAVRDTLLLAEPLKAVCSETCQGLCLKCGADLNAGDCGCDREIIDPRLAALQKLLEKSNT